MNKKRVKRLMVMLVVMIVMLTSCKTQDTSTQGSGGDKVTDITGKSEEGESLPEVELSVILVGTEQKDIAIVQEKISELTKGKINATVKITTIPFSSWTQQTSLMLASGEPIDLLWTSSSFNYNGNVASGQLYALDDLLATYGEGITDSMDQRFMDACKVDGKIYGIPSIRDFAADYGFIMRKDMIERYNIDIDGIKEPSDMGDIFKVVEANEPTMDGFMTAYPNTYTEIFGQTKYDKLGNWFGVVELDDDTYKVINWFETDYYEELLYLVRDWYEKGYISKDAATITEMPEALVKADKLFSFSYNGKPGVALQESKKSGKEVVYVPFTKQISTTGTITNGMISIPITSTDPERAMMLMNLWYSDPELVNLFDNGVEGIHYVKGDNGLLNYPEGVDATNATYVPITWRIGNNFLADVWEGLDADIWQQMESFNNDAQASVALGFTFDVDPVKTEIAAVTNVISGYQMALETGTLDVSTVLPEFIAKLKAAGIDEIIEEKQQQLNVWAQSKE